jgi:hypothetical protein
LRAHPLFGVVETWIGHGDLQSCLFGHVRTALPSASNTWT